jgi:hypothetical protein
LSAGNDNQELVHLARDPGETGNLWDGPQRAGARHALTEQLALRMILPIVSTTVILLPSAW